MIIESKNVHIRYYIVEEKEILNIKKLALQLEKHCRKSLDIMFGLMARIDKVIIPNYNLIEMKHIEMKHIEIKSEYSLRSRKNISYVEKDTFDDPKDTDYVFEEVDEDQDDDDYEEDEEEDEEEDDYDDEEEDDKEDKQFISDYYNDPDYNPDEENENNYTFLNKFVDKNGEIVLNPGIDNNDDDDNIECDYHDVIHPNGYEPEQELIYNYKNNKLVNVCKRRVENGNAIYTKINM